LPILAEPAGVLAAVEGGNHSNRGGNSDRSDEKQAVLENAYA
jgi:hypothetical protein